MRRCNHESTERYNAYHDGKGIVEYSVRCRNCGKHLGVWSYGVWFDEDEWEEVEQPLTFKEVLESVEEDATHRFKVEFEELEGRGFPCNKYFCLGSLLKMLESNLFNNELARVLLEGKFYINEEKQTAKKPQKIILRQGPQWLCPACGNTVAGLGAALLYCNECGQKIDWSVEE